RAYALYNRSTYRLQYDELSEASSKLNEELIAAGKQTGRTKVVNELTEQINNWSTFIDESVMPLILSGDTENALNKLSQAEVQAVQITYQFKKLSEENQTNIQNVGDQIISEAKQIEQIILLTVIISLILGILI